MNETSMLLQKDKYSNLFSKDGWPNLELQDKQKFLGKSVLQRSGILYYLSTVASKQGRILWWFLEVKWSNKRGTQLYAQLQGYFKDLMVINSLVGWNFFYFRNKKLSAVFHFSFLYKSFLKMNLKHFLKIMNE